MQGIHEQRPQLSPAMSGTEFSRWYWLKNELVVFARLLNLRTTGDKQALTARITAHLEGRTFHESPPKERAPSRHQLHAPLFPGTVIPRGQRCSQILRAWFREQVGQMFTFDAAMRAFFAEADGTGTLRDALDHWHHTRAPLATHIDAQFEYNLFTRAWCKDHPRGTRDDLLRAWWKYRSTPMDERGRD